MQNEQALLVYMTFASSAQAVEIINTLVQERLLACANIMPEVHSIYWWQGAVEQTTESAAIGKTMQNQYQALEKRLCELHPYETPCLVALPITTGFAPYLQWLADETSITP